MAKIANVAPSTSLNSWATATNALADRLSQFAINNSSLYANTITANNSLRALKNLTVSGNTTIAGLIANGSIGTSNYVLRTNGVSVYWAPGGGSTSQYITVANANALYTTKAYAAANSYVKSQLANTNLRVNLINTNLTGTNTAIRLLVSDRLQVANASSTYQTKAVERAALANTNSYIGAQSSRITLVNSNLTATNTAIRSFVTSEITNLIGGAPGALNTLSELATALGNNASFSATITTLLAAKATWAGLTSTNTAIRLLVSDRLQVANAAATYQTKTIERAALANTNSRITLVNTNLTGTNTAIRLLVSDRLQVANAAVIYQTKSVERAALANTNAFIKSQLANTNLRVNLINTNLTSTNTAIRALDTAKLSVANAVATYQTKTVERAALANTNAFIKSQLANTNLRVNLINTNLTGTNTAIRLLVSDRLQIANVVATYATKVSPTTSGVLAHTGRATISTNLTVSGNTVVSGLLANGSLGTSNYVLKTNGTTVFWGASSGGSGGGILGTYTVATLGSLAYSANVVTSVSSALANTNAYIATKVSTGKSIAMAIVFGG
jgi:hypothetical protein